MLVNNAIGAPEKPTNATEHREMVAASVPSLTHSLLGDPGMNNSIYTIYNRNHMYSDTLSGTLYKSWSVNLYSYKLSTPLGGIDDVTVHAADHDRGSNPKEGMVWCITSHLIRNVIKLQSLLSQQCQHGVERHHCIILRILLSEYLGIFLLYVSISYKDSRELI